MVRMEGLEPPRLAAPEPKSGVSTNFTTSATERRTRYEARDIEGSAYKYQGLFRKPCILRPLQMKIRYVFECVQRGCLNVNRFDVDPGLFFGSMVPSRLRDSSRVESDETRKACSTFIARAFRNRISVYIIALVSALGDFDQTPLFGSR